MTLLIREMDRERAITHADVSWNHLEFEVNYPSLSGEIQVMSHYLRLLIDSENTNAVKDLREPRRFFMALYHRAMRENAAGSDDLATLCFRCMSLVKQVHHKAVGVFDDTPYIARMLAHTLSNARQAWKLRLLQHLE